MQKEIESKRLTNDFGIKLCEDLVNNFYDKLNEFFINERGKLMEPDVITMLMNVCLGVATNFYYSIKSCFPETELDYAFIKATVINRMVENFDKLKDMNFGEYVSLTPEQVDDLEKSGSAIVETSEGKEAMVTKEQLRVKRKDLNHLAEKKSRIILPN